MNKNITIIFVSICLVLAITSCDDELPTMASFADYTYSSLDQEAGSWTPILQTSADQVAIDAPFDITSDAYIAELTDLKSASANLTDDQRKKVKYWTNNPLIRWNEIALELVAKYNLIPGPNEDDTYTLPNPASPEGPPAFPFAHPPYACRAFAYLSVAQFDGLISAWHYKYMFNRPAPYNVDDAIAPAYEKSSLPSYPSDGAVIAASSREVLSVMFPLEKEYLASISGRKWLKWRLQGQPVMV